MSNYYFIYVFINKLIIIFNNLLNFYLKRFLYFIEIYKEPLGTYWMILLTDQGNIPSVDEVIARNLVKSVDAPVYKNALHNWIGEITHCTW